MKNKTTLEALLQSIDNDQPKALEGTASGLVRTLSAEELVQVSGGRLAVGGTCSNGECDDCG